MLTPQHGATMWHPSRPSDRQVQVSSCILVVPFVRFLAGGGGGACFFRALTAIERTRACAARCAVCVCVCVVCAAKHEDERSRRSSRDGRARGESVAGWSALC